MDKIRLNKLEMCSSLSDMTFDFLVIMLDIPALIWYWWLDVLVKRGWCGGDTGTTYGIYMQLLLSVYFYLTLRLIKILWHTPGNSY